MSLRPGEVRGYMAQETTSGEMETWVEVKRTAEDMEDMIMVAGARDTMRKWQAREVSYPRARGSVEPAATRPWISFDADEELIMQEPSSMVESPGTLNYSPEQ